MARAHSPPAGSFRAPPRGAGPPRTEPSGGRQLGAARPGPERAPIRPSAASCSRYRPGSPGAGGAVDASAIGARPAGDREATGVSGGWSGSSWAGDTAGSSGAGACPARDRKATGRSAASRNRGVVGGPRRIGPGPPRADAAPPGPGSNSQAWSPRPVAADRSPCSTRDRLGRHHLRRRGARSTLAHRLAGGCGGAGRW